MSWRPENWDSKAIVDRVLTSDKLTTGMTASQELVEAGADAMLEALKKRAIDPHEIRTYEFDKKNPLRISFSDEGFGSIVFIPDEEEV